MDFDLTEEQRLLAESARAFARHELAPKTADWSRDHHFPVEVVRVATEQGYLGLYIAEGGGGLGLSRLSTSLIFEQLAAGCMATTAYISIRNMAAWIFVPFGDAALKEAWLPGLIDGESLASYYLTEPDAGSDAARLRTRTHREDDEYVLGGSKCFISGAGNTQVLIVMVHIGENGARGVSCFLVPAGAPDIRYGRNEDRMGWRAQSTRIITFEGVRTPTDNRVGPKDQGFVYTMKGLGGGHLSIASCSPGAAQAALGQSIRYVEEYEQLSKPLATFQALQFKLADVLTELTASHQMVRPGAHRLDRGDAEATLYCTMAKRFATDRCFDVCNETLQLHGGRGHLNDYPLGRWVHDIHVHQILEGTNEIIRVIVARRLLEQGGALDRLLWAPRTIVSNSAGTPWPMIQ